MTERTIYWIFWIPILLIMVSGCSSPQEKQKQQQPLSGDLEITKAWARPASRGANSAAYFTIYNGTSDPDTLTGIKSEDTAKAEVHESYVTEDGLSGMRPAGTLAIPSGDSLLLQPGSFHVMLMGMKRNIAVGDSIQLQLQFSGSGSQTISAGIR